MYQGHGCRSHSSIGCLLSLFFDRQAGARPVANATLHVNDFFRSLGQEQAGADGRAVAGSTLYDDGFAVDDFMATLGKITQHDVVSAGDMSFVPFGLVYRRQ